MSFIDFALYFLFNEFLTIEPNRKLENVKRVWRFV